MTEAQLKTNLARLSMKIVRETDQVKCDLMEAELIAIQRQLEGKPPIIRRHIRPPA
jgi:hypothetical protein